MTAPITICIYYSPEYYYGDSVSKRAVGAVFQALFLLTDIRVLLRETAPGHELDAGQREQAARACEKIKKQIAILEEELA